MYEGILQIKQLDLSKYQKPKSLRNQLIDEVYNRMKLKEKPWSKARIAMRLADSCKSDMDIHFLWKKCGEADNYVKCFFGLTKIK